MSLLIMISGGIFMEAGDAEAFIPSISPTVALSSGLFSIDIKNPISTPDFHGLVENFLLWILGVAGVVALFMLIAGGIMYMMAGGDEQKVATAKKMITWTILGLAIVLVSYSIISVLDSILT